MESFHMDRSKPLIKGMKFRNQVAKKHEVYKKLKHILETRNVPELQKQKLLQAVSLNNAERIETLLKAGVDPNTCDSQSRSALHISCSKGFVDVVALLLKYGADPNIKDSIENTPLHLAACTSNLKIIKILINAGADISILDMHGRNSLQLAESKLQILMSTWKKGPAEMETIYMQLRQIVDIMVELWRQQSMEKEEDDILNLKLEKLMNLSVTASSSDAEVENQFANLMMGLQQFTIK